MSLLVVQYLRSQPLLIITDRRAITASPALQLLQQFRRTSDLPRGRPGAATALPAVVATNPSSLRAAGTGQHANQRMVSADRAFLLAGSGGSHQVLLHDSRDVKHLKLVTMGGLFATLMSSSALSYAALFDLGPAAIGALALQSISAAVMFLYVYPRTYVARAVLDPRRATLSLTGCGLLGEPLASDEKIPLAMLHPGTSRCDTYIKFRTRAPALDPSSWVWYRMPRAHIFDGSIKGKVATQVGLRAETEKRIETPEATAAATLQSARLVKGPRFPGAGLGDKAQPAVPDAPKAPRPRGPASHAATAAQSRPDGRMGDGASQSSQEEASLPYQSLANLRLKNGLPASPAEEQKLLDFFDDPTAYALARR